MSFCQPEKSWTKFEAIDPGLDVNRIPIKKGDNSILWRILTSTTGNLAQKLTPKTFVWQTL